jgi:hypothetical protein
VKTLVVSISFVASVAFSTLALVTYMVYGGAGTPPAEPSAELADQIVQPAVDWETRSGTPASTAGPPPTPKPRRADPTAPAVAAANLPIAALPTVKPSPTIELSSPKLAYEARPGCDPAYPEERTCIPPGPPFDQGCKITEQRLFTVLPPDPQHLDSDGDGIGCEPVRSS